MTPVLFHFVTPTGLPIANTPFEIQLAKADFDREDSGVVMPRLVTAITDVDGKATVNLWPHDTLYYVTVIDPASDAGLSYKFLVPEVTPGLEVRLQDIVLVGEISETTYDTAAIAIIHAAKALTLSYQVAAAASAASAAADAVNVGAFATTATTQADIATTKAAEAAADRVQTGLDRIATAADRVQTGLDRTATLADKTQTALDAVATAADRVQTGLDRAQTLADKTQTALDAIDTAADAVATAADRVQTGLDRTAASTSATTATTGATTATTKAAEAVVSAAEAAASAVLAASTVTGVSTVNTRSGAVVLTSADVGLNNADNTSDINKPVSTAQAAADTAIGSAAATDATTKANAAQAAAIAASTPAAHAGSGGGAHANAVAAGAAGFMTGADKTKLDAITGTHAGTTSGTNTGDETGARVAALNHAAAVKSALVDADETTGQDSAAGWGLIRTTWGSIKVFLKTYFDTLYATKVANTFTGAQVYGDQVLSRGMTKDMGLVFVDKGNSGTAAQTLDYTAGSHQKLTVTGAFVMNAVTNWPPTGNTGEVLLELINGASSAITWTMAGTTQRWWKRDGTEVATYASSGYALKAAGTDWILMWSTDGGTTTNIKVQ